MSTTETEHKHSFPVNDGTGSILNPGVCECGKTYAQAQADRMLTGALEAVAVAYGVPPRMSTHWAVAWGSEKLNAEPEACAHYAHVDLDDLRAADTVISFTSEGGGGKGGRHIEFGLALGLGKRLVIVGPRENVFHTLPDIEWYPSWAHLVMAWAPEFAAASAHDCGPDERRGDDPVSATETPQEAPAGSLVVGTAIREARIKAEMTQDDLAEALGVTQTCVSYWENARRDLGVTDLLRVAAAINVRVVDLLGAEYFEAPEPEPPLPDGIFGRVELPGYRQHTGWITEEPRFGQQMAVVRDWDGREIAMAALGPGCQVVVLPTPRKRPEPPKALTSGSAWDDEDDDYDEEAGDDD